MNSLPSETVLLAFDFTEPALNALAVAIQYCRQQQTGLHLLHVLPSDVIDVTSSAQSGQELSTNHLVREADSMLQTLALLTSQEQQITCSGSCRTGLIYEVLIREAYSRNTELIIMGTHTGSDLQAFRTNNEAYQVIKTAPCPVLTVPDIHQHTTFNRILFPVRPIPDAVDKYDFARKIIRQNDAELTVLALTVPNEVVSMDQLQDELSRLGEKLAQDGVNSRTLFCPTDAMAETVLEKTKDLQSDLLIITARLATTSDNFFIGPFTQQIIHNARIPVLAIRPEAHTERAVGQLSWPNTQTDSESTAIDR